MPADVGGSVDAGMYEGLQRMIGLVAEDARAIGRLLGTGSWRGKAKIHPTPTRAADDQVEEFDRLPPEPAWVEISRSIFP
jgi:hypothetical protein